MQITDVFIDTNVFLYAYDNKEPEKQRKALECLKPFFEEELTASISIQVLQELTHQLLRKNFDLNDIETAIRPLTLLAYYRRYYEAICRSLKYAQTLSTFVLGLIDSCCCKPIRGETITFGRLE